MRKITGKALATVLAMALITSSFSGTFAFAATKTEKAGSVDFSADDEVTLVKDGSNQYLFDLNELIGTMSLTTVDKAEKKQPVSEDDISFRHAKGDNLISIKDGMARVKSDKTGTETIMVYGETVITRDDKDVTLKGQKEITIHVVESGTLFVAVKDTDDKGFLAGKTGDEIPGLDISFNDRSVKELAIYEATAAADLQAKYKEVDNKDGKDLRIEASKNTRFNYVYEKDKDDKDTDGIVSIQNNGKGTGTLKLSIKSDKNGNGSYSTTEDSTTASILKRIDIRDDVTISKENSKTIISGEGVKADVKDTPVADMKWGDLSGTSVAGYDIRVLSDATSADKALKIDVQENVNVGKITSDLSEGSEVKVTVTTDEKSKIGDIEDIDNVSIDSATVGKIDVRGSVEMSDGRAESIEADGSVTLNGGTVTGNVVSDDDGDGVTVDVDDDEINTVVNGTIEAVKVSVKNNSDDGKVQIANIVLKDDGVLTLSNSDINIDKIDGAYEGNVDFVDFQGTVKNILNASDVTVDEDSEVVVEGAVEMETLDISEDGSVDFRDTVKVSNISGEGKLVVAAGKLHVTDGVSGEVKLRLAGNNVSVGDVAFTADKDAADVDSFAGVGFKMEKKSVDKNTDSFLVKSVSFAGLALDKTEVTIAKGFSNTVTVSNYPASTSLPTGASVVWDFSDADKDIFDITADGATLNIAVKDYDDVYATSNSFDLYATVVDKDGDALEDYDSAKCTVNAIKEVPVSSDLSGIVEVPQGSTKDFVVNSSIEAPVTIGTGDVAVHAVKTPFANAQATYTIKATGAVGTTAGVYATVPGQVATKLFIIKVTAPVVTSDTTVDFDLTAGSRYVFKITAPAAPSFTVGNGAVLKTQAGKIDGNDYYFAVYAQNVAGQSTGVYVNGVKVCTVTVK